MDHVTPLVPPETRHRRHTLTRLGLITAAAHRLEQKTFDALLVREISETLSLSESAFYQHFAKKSDLLGYIAQLWLLEIHLSAERAAHGRDGLAFISALFTQASHLFACRPGLTKEVTAFIIRQRPEHRLPNLSELERKLAFPDFANAATIKSQSIIELFTHHVRYAVEHHQLPAHTNVHATASALTSLLFGAASAPLSALRGNTRIHHQQLNQFLVGIKSARAVAAPDENNVPSLHQRHANKPSLRDR